MGKRKSPEDMIRTKRERDRKRWGEETRGSKGSDRFCFLVYRGRGADEKSVELTEDRVRE